MRPSGRWFPELLERSLAGRCLVASVIIAQPPNQSQRQDDTQKVFAFHGFTEPANWLLRLPATAGRRSTSPRMLRRSTTGQKQQWLAGAGTFLRFVPDRSRKQ